MPQKAFLINCKRVSSKQIKEFFLEGERTTLKTFNNYTIIMSNNSGKIRIL